ncbi:MAG: cation-translocating P-type ATPase [Lachnospiraceae bacterium]|nr:cation-translocating P-type ATPase [Lachnospiraceae bacterium]
MIKNWLENEPKETCICAVVSVISLLLSISKVLESTFPFDIAWIAIVLCGIPILIGAFKGVIFEHDIKADLLVSLALIASVLTKEFFAAGEVALIMQIGSLLEDYTSGKAKESIEKLIKLTPQKAAVLCNGEYIVKPVEEVKPGDILRVIAGETIPVDGTIVEGETAIDQSVMTGESIPVDKSEGDKVFSGTLNQYGVFSMRADAISSDSSLQRMVKLAKEAEENKAPIVTAADKWATWLVIIALSCAGITWAATGEFIRAVTVLVVFCPCAFILATPTAVLAGIGNAAKYGIIIRSGSALEKLSIIKRIAFDKTGTLTYGKPEVQNVFSNDDRFDENEILKITALAEQLSEHPLGKAIWNAYVKNGGEKEEVKDFQVIAGQGVSAQINGMKILAGKKDFMILQGISADDLKTIGNKEKDNSTTLVYVAADGKAIGMVSLKDTVKAGVTDTIKRLKDIGLSPILLTGDNNDAAGSAARDIGITDFKANLLPEEKMAIIKDMAGKHEPVCMIGDGVNDALALTAADAGIAMGGIGSDIAIESADAVLVSDEIKRLPYLFMLVRKVMKKVKLNIIASLVINLSAVILSALGILTPITGALWHNCGSVFVVVNAALLLRTKDENDI